MPAKTSSNRGPVIEGRGTRRWYPVTARALAVLMLGLGVIGCDRGSDSAQEAAATGFRADVTAAAEDGRARVNVVLTDARDEADYEVVEPGSYRLNVDLADSGGARVLSTTGTGELDSGPGLIYVEVPVEVAERVDVAGELEVVDATLSRGGGAPNRAASSSSVGTVPAPQW